MGPSIASGQGVPAAGGAETQILILARTLADRGLSICVVCLDVPGGLPPSHMGVDIIVRRPYAGSLGVARSLVSTLIGRIKEASRVVAAVGSLSAKVVVQRTASADTGLVWLACALSGKRFVWSSANVSDFDFSEAAGSRVEARLFNLGARSADAIVVQTEDQVSLCRRAFKVDPVLIPSFAETLIPAGGSGGTVNGFIWAGRVVHSKQPLEYLEMASANPELEFGMVAVPNAGGGSDELMAAVASRARSLPNLTLLEPRPRSDLIELIASSIAVVSTSIHEGMPNVFLEAWSLGVPTLSLHLDPDGVIGEFGLGLCAGGEIDVLAEFAGRLARDPRLRSQISERALDYVRTRHSPDQVAGRWLSVLVR